MARNHGSYIPPGYRFLMASLLLLMAVSSAFRAILFLMNLEFASHSTASDILYAFFNRGLLFDIHILSYLFILPFLMVSIPQIFGKTSKIFLQISNILILIGGIAVMLVFAIDLGYFKYYNSRITGAVFTWLEDVDITLKVIFTELDNLMLALAFLAVTVAYARLQNRILRVFLNRESGQYKVPYRVLTFSFGLLLMIFGLRGTYNFKDTPLIYRNAFFTEDHFMNQLGFNPVYQLGYSFNDFRINYFKTENEFIDAGLKYLGRDRSESANPFETRISCKDSHRPNILIIFLESMSNAMVSRYNPDLNTTPFLDSLAEKGAVFDRTYSAGIHTHNAIFTALYGLPAVMNKVPMNSLATENQVFHGLPFILKEKGYCTSFYVTGSKEFDNIYRFLSINGFDRIVGDQDYPHGAIYNLWGATDETMFREVLDDCDSLSKLGLPFFSGILTISSHDGYLVPEDYESRLKNRQYPEKLYEYADLQLRNFMLAAAGKEWFDSTVFVFIGDHGQNFDPVYDMNLNYHRVPLIFFAPEFIEPLAYSNPALQQDIYPSLCGMLDMSYVNNGLGVDLFRQQREFGYFSADNKLGVTDDSHYLIFREKGNISLYSYPDNSIFNLYPDKPEKTKSMLDYAFSMVQSAAYLIENRLTDIKLSMEERYNVDRFIAHAGGMIDGHTYTNSLEALDHSYAAGFRLLELDIMRTSDGEFAAVHEWDEWQEMTGYNGKTPPSHDVFMEQRLLGKYTPMDMDRINAWFSAHPDAILVTDKINAPVAFSSAFIDKGRLMMELFSLEAVREGARAGILSAMPSWSVLSEIEGDQVQALRQMGITDISASRRVIGNNLPLLIRLKTNGIRVYVFHVNYDKGIDEAYVIANEMDFIYGMYADKMDFQPK
jgi:phosphoglycerol transferase MdoB-like AlkP superfamily enzyme